MTDEEDSELIDEGADEATALIDDEGNLLGVINVIDALAILLVLAVVVAGIALVAAPDDTDSEEPEPDTETRYATINLGTQPDYVATRVTIGDTMDHETGDAMSRDWHNLTVTDVYVTPVKATQSAVTVRVRLDGELGEEAPNAPRFVFAGNRYRVGDSLSIKTDEYGAKGSIQALDEEGTDLNTEYITTEIKLTNTDPDVAAAVSEAADQSSNGEPLVTVQGVTSQPAEVVLQSEDGNIYLRDHPVNQDLRLRTELRTIATDSGNRYHSGPLRVGDSIRLDLGTTTVSGTVTSVGQ